ncbi:MAG: ABC transporter permease subunit [Planctomycetota bacterium]
MNRGVLLKTIRESWIYTLLLASGLFTFEALLAWILPTFLARVPGNWLQLDFIRNILKALLGTDLAGQIGPFALYSIAWVHPVALAILFAQALVLCSRLAGEIDRATIDVLLSWPVSRWQAYISETVVWLVSGAVILLLGLFGHILVRSANPSEVPLTAGRLFIVLLNFYCLYYAVGAFTCFVSSWSDHRGRVIGIAFAIVLASFFLNFIAQFWEPAKALAFLGVLNYYRPLPILESGAFPLGHILALLGLGTLFWSAGGLVFARRDIRTV